jgi:two-component system sensor histidine kinase YesM
MYELPDYLFRMYILYICLSLAAGIGLSLYFANNSNKQIRTILAIFNSAKKGKFHVSDNRMPVIKNSYQYILYNIINTFIEKDYLTTQLSERKYKGRLDEMMARQSQMNPHFLFNTLQTIQMKALSLGKGPNEVSYMIEHLSSILRYSLHDPSRFVRLEEEIAQAKSYIAIQSIRYKDAIKVTWKYDASILNFGTLRLLFQPLLENSIVHGIKEQEIPGEILIVVEEEQDYLSVTVADTGAGIPEETLKKIREDLAKQEDRFEHIGLYNTDRRIKLAFGDAYGISIDSETGYGTIVQIKLPKFRFC